MMEFLRLIAIALLASTIACGSDPEANMKVPEIIAHWGYPCESITVYTPDDYELTMHRIPFGKDQDPDKKRPVMFLQHGLEAASSNWVTNLPHLAMGFMAADAGFDVWMGNVRGNLYSIGHKTLDTKGHEYWKFSWDQMTMYDLPTMINHTLNVTGQPHLYYVAHSQGSLIMFSYLSMHPDFGQKIKQFHALAPIATVKNIKGLLEVVAKDFYFGVEILYKFLGEDQFAPENGFLHLLEEMLCKGFLLEEACNNVLFLFTGPDSVQMNVTRLPVFLADEPSGTSTQNVIHWTQNVRSGHQQMFDFENEKKNIEHYGQSTPPIYDIRNIRTPMYLYWSPKDWLADQKDIEENLLPILNPEFLIENKKVQDFNHLDFVWGSRAASELYTPLINTVLRDINDN